MAREGWVRVEVIWGEEFWEELWGWGFGGGEWVEGGGIGVMESEGEGWEGRGGWGVGGRVNSVV